MTAAGVEQEVVTFGVPVVWDALEVELLLPFGVVVEAVAELSHEVEVLVQTGTETVHGQSVTVKVVLAVIV